MTEPRRFFTDGEAYDRMMGQWSRAAGAKFLDWLSLPAGLRWIDVGCGTGAFTELVLERCAPASIAAVDPSADQVEFARSQSAGPRIDYRVAGAEHLPFDDGQFDVGTMALVLTFVSEPAKAIAEIGRVVRTGGTIATYNWDIAGGGHTQEPIRAAIRAMGVTVPPGPNDEIARRESLLRLFRSAGLADVSTETIEIRVDYPSFEEYWASQTGLENTTVRPIRALSAPDVERLKTIVRERVTTDGGGRVSYVARCNAVRAIVPA